jgi:hypothetical protein
MVYPDYDRMDGHMSRPGADGDSIRFRQCFWAIVATSLRTSGMRCRKGDDLTEVVEGTGGRYQGKQRGNWYNPWAWG